MINYVSSFLLVCQDRSMRFKARFTGFPNLAYRYLVGTLGQVISLSLGLYLHKTTRTRTKAYTNLYLEWHSNI
jgi:hypothetical protein